MKKFNKNRLKIVFCLLPILSITLFCYLFFYSTVYKSCVIEAGYTFVASDLEKWGYGDICFTDEDFVLDTTVVGSYTVEVTKGYFTHTCEITVQDTVAPTADSIDLTVGYLVEVMASDCVENVFDATNVTCDFINEIDRTNDQPQNITVILQDEGGNTTEISSTITVSDDCESPVITAPNVIESPLGNGIAYLQLISATDNSGNDVDISIDNSSVDIDTEGEYTILCTATDWVGNESSLEVMVSVYMKTALQETVEEYADNVLEDIIDDSMSQYDICEAIFYWCRNNIAYIGSSQKGDWVTGAYDGFYYGSGDCYTYFATAKVLLTQAGINNMDIEKIPSTSEHYWNLVDIGDGWIHFDTTRRSDGTLIFLWTDEELMEYSNSHNGSHNYDTSLYPDIQ